MAIYGLDFDASALSAVYYLIADWLALVIGMVWSENYPCPSLSILAGQMTGDEAIGSLPTYIILLHHSSLVR